MTGRVTRSFLTVTPKSNTSRRPTIITNALASFRTLCNRKGLTVGNRAVVVWSQGVQLPVENFDPLTKVQKALPVIFVTLNVNTVKLPLAILLEVRHAWLTLLNVNYVDCRRPLPELWPPLMTFDKYSPDWQWWTEAQSIRPDFFANDCGLVPFITLFLILYDN